MTKNRKRYAATFKTKVVLELLSNHGTLNEAASKYQIDPTMLSKWKHSFLDAAPGVFEDKRKKDDRTLEKEVYIGEVEKKAGQLTLERDWLKKNLMSSLGSQERKACIVNKFRALIDPGLKLSGSHIILHMILSLLEDFSSVRKFEKIRQSSKDS